VPLETHAWRAARIARHLPDRLLHSWRRQRLIRRLTRSRGLRRVLFVCHGNICRSPYAAASFLRRLPPAFRANVQVASAGFIGPGRPSPDEALAVSRRRGIDLSSHTSQLIDAQALRDYDLVVVMDGRQARDLKTAYADIGSVIVLGDLDPQPITRRAIVDPFGRSEQVFDESYARIDRCLDTLIGAAYSFDH
jgi:protein-tyrosine-phosphatase